MRIQSKDVAFLDGDTARGVRLQLDFPFEEGLIDVEGPGSILVCRDSRGDIAGFVALVRAQ